MLFHSPLFGVFAVEEEREGEKSNPLPVVSKILLYGLALGAGTGIYLLLSWVFGGGHEVIAAAVVTAVLLGAAMKKPLAVTMLLFLCFPVRIFLWIFLAAAIGSKVG